MSQIWLVAQQHFRQEVLKRSFILVMLSLPAFLALSVGMGILGENLSRESTTLGYVDLAQVIQTTDVEGGDHDVELLPFESREAARSALEDGRIDAYFVLPPDYAETGHADLVFLQEPHWSATQRFRSLLRRNLLADQPQQVADRVLSDSRVTVRALDQGRQFPEAGPSAGQVVPLAVGVVLAFLIMTTAGYLMDAVVKERENRTMEIIMTSISPGQMMSGKIISGLAMGLILLLVWSAFFVGAVLVARNALDLAWLQEITINWLDVLKVVIVALPTLLFVGALLALIGTLAGGKEEADQIGPFTFIVLLTPLYLILPLLRDPGGTLAVVMSLLPPTAVMTVAFRSLVSIVPWWQVASAAVISLLSAAGVTWLASKAVRASMLRYGKRLRLRDVFAAA
jgi:ABC-2 type transport system permease protein